MKATGVIATDRKDTVLYSGIIYIKSDSKFYFFSITWSFFRNYRLLGNDMINPNSSFYKNLESSFRI